MFLSIILRHNLQSLGAELLVVIGYPRHDAVTTVFRTAVSFALVFNPDFVAHLKLWLGLLLQRLDFRTS